MLNLALNLNLMFERLNKGFYKSIKKTMYLVSKIKILLKDWSQLTYVCFLFQLAITSHYEKY